MGMKLKSGADLCGFELSRFCVQNDVAIPDAPASGRKYFHTGTGMEGKYSLLGRERIFTGTSWRAAAYVDDLANLDLATNEDYLALKEKVELLSGEVDTDAIINNMKEVTAFLSGFAEDASLMDLLNSKFDKTGGTITGSLVKRTTGQNYITFEDSDGNAYGYLGFNGANTPMYIPKEANAIYTLLHSGNVGDYAVKIDGSSRMKAEKGLKWDSFEGGNSDNFDSSFFVGRDASDGSALATSKRPYTAVLNIGGTAVGGYRFQLASYVGPTHNELYYRGYNNNGSEWKDWKTIAFTDSDITGYAAGLKHSNGVIAAQIDPYGNIGFGTSPKNKIHIVTESKTTPTIFINDSSAISGYLKPLEALYPNAWSGANFDLYIGVAESANNGGYLRFYYDAAGSDNNRLSFGLYGVDNVVNILGSGYVGIGTNNPQAKLHVSQDIVANGTIACKGVAAQGSVPVGTVDKWAGSIATGTKSQTYTHGLGTTDITVAIYEKNGNEWVQILTDVDIVNANTIRVTFGANTTVEHRIVVMG